MNNLWVWGSLILGGLALEFFDVDQSTRNWIAIVVVGLFLTHIASEKEDKDRKIIEKIDERLDALELQQYKQRDANRRIAELEEQLESIQSLESVKIDSTIEKILKNVEDDRGIEAAKEVRKLFYD
jgi:hypothetical protein